MLHYIRAVVTRDLEFCLLDYGHAVLSGIWKLQKSPLPERDVYTPTLRALVGKSPFSAVWLAN